LVALNWVCIVPAGSPSISKVYSVLQLLQAEMK